MSNFTATIFLPKKLEGKESGLIYGRVKINEDSVDNPGTFVVVVLSRVSQPEHIVGSIGKNLENSSQKYMRNVWLEVDSERGIAIRSVSVYGYSLLLQDITVVYYDREEIWESELIPQKYSLKKNQQNECVIPYFVDCIVREEEKSTIECKPIIPRSVLLFEMLIYILTFIPKITIRSIHLFLQNKLDYTSNALQQIILRISQIEELAQLIQRKRKNIVTGRLIAMIFVDIILGMSVAYIISHHASVNDMYDTFCEWTKKLSSVVQDLLEWLSGAPAGLKLNQPLTQALSAFFSYHVHLWRLYLELADPLLKGLAWILVWLGMFGLSVQVAILSDLLDLATLHLYCFYVYAARIHMLQISLLGSQWRAFRGRKWNPLKLRIDSDTGNHMSLKRVLTAVVFTLVIFLLPTTTVYYLVFVMLRVSLSTVRGVLGFCIWLLNANPLYLVMLNLTGSNCIRGDIYMKPFGITTDQPSSVLFCLHTWPTPVTEALAYAKSDVLPVQPRLNWKAILSSVVFGRELL